MDVQCDAEWWQKLGRQAGTAELSEVQSVSVDRARDIEQNNCTVRFYKLRTRHGEQLSVALKYVNLDANKCGP
jgi:hypothetical protein